MSLLSNNNTLYLNNRWISPWYENNPIYTNLLYSDIYIYELLNGIYYQLKMPSSLPIIKQLNYDQLIIILNIYVYRKKKQKRINLFYKEKVEFKFFYKKMMFLLHKSLYKKRKYKKFFNRKILNSMILKKNIYRKNNKDIYVPIIKKREKIDINFKIRYLIYKIKKKKYRIKNKYNKKVKEEEKQKIIFNYKNVTSNNNKDLIFFLNRYRINKKKNRNIYNKLIKLKYRSLFLFIL
jgi:hypothetical protein